MTAWIEICINSIDHQGRAMLLKGLQLNMELEHLHVDDKTISEPILRKILHWIRLNRAGRRIFRETNLKLSWDSGRRTSSRPSVLATTKSRARLCLFIFSLVTLLAARRVLYYRHFHQTLFLGYNRLLAISLDTTG